MPKVCEILEYLNELAPVQYAMSYDNVGLLVGDGEREVGRILVALDITDSVIDEAKECGADLIVAHHPVIFEPLKRVVCGDVTANHVISLIKSDISAICMHTNLDSAVGGVNDMLAQKLGVASEAVIEEIEPGIGIGRVGALASPMEFNAFLKSVLSAVSAPGLRYHKSFDVVSRVAVGGGSCGSMLGDVKKLGCDTFVTADIKHSQWLEAAEIGLNLIDAGHFSSENVIVAPLAASLAERFLDIPVTVSEMCHEPIAYYCNEGEHHGS